MTRGRIVAGVLIACFVISVSALGLLYAHYRAYVGRTILPQGEHTQLTIPKGASWNEIVDVLETADLVTNRRYFEFWATQRGLDRAVKAGHFDLDGPMTLDTLEVHLRAGGYFDEVVVTIVEGQNIFQIADMLDAKGILDRKAFLAAARDRDALDAAEIEGDSFEGFLFPDTYRVKKGASAQEFVKRFHRRFNDVWEEEYSSATTAAALEKEYALTRDNFVTMASIVEKETGDPDERPLIARVFYNRLTKGMRLQTDPTCVYSERTYKRVPRPSLCKDKLNRYSTYVIEGLPPGPIANPGRMAIRAALQPASTPESKQLLFFVAKRDGSRGHYFSKTYAEHKKAVRRFLKKKR